MNYALRRLTEELEDQLEIQKSFESKTIKSESIEKVLLITARRIGELDEALKLLNSSICHETQFS